MSREDAQMKIRLPAELKSAVEAAAKANNRTLNAEIVAQLQRGSARPREEMSSLLSRLEGLIKQRERDLRDAGRLLAPVLIKAAEGLPDDAPMPGDPTGRTAGFYRAIFTDMVGEPPKPSQDDLLSNAVTWTRLSEATKHPSEG